MRFPPNLSRHAVNALALVVFALIAVRASTVADPYWDTLAYHWPFAARAAGLCDAGCFAFDEGTEVLYRSFPMLYHLAFGELWRIFGTPAAGHWISIAALAALCGYLWKRFDVPPAWSWLGFVAIPIVQVHLSASYSDITGNALLTIAIFIILRVIVTREPPLAWEWAVALLALAVTGATKLQFIPLAALAWCALCVAAAIAWRGREGALPWLRVGVLLVAGLAATLPQAVHNLAAFANPFYPMSFKLGGHRFPGVMSVEDMQKGMSVADPWLRYPAPLRWVASVLEFDALGGRPGVWTVDQADIARSSRAFRMGGYFVVYVLGMLALAATRLGERRAGAFAWLFAVLTLLCMLLPNSHELRYYHFWMLTLVGGVLALAHSPLFAPSAAAPAASGPEATARLHRLRNPLAEPLALRQAAHGFIAVVLLSVILATGARYVSTVGARASRIATYTDAVVGAMAPGSTLCIANRHRTAVFYTRLFHPRSDVGVRVLREGEGTAGCDRVVDPR